MSVIRILNKNGWYRRLTLEELVYSEDYADLIVRSFYLDSLSEFRIISQSEFL